MAWGLRGVSRDGTVPGESCICTGREGGRAVLRLRGGYTPKKTRKSVSKRKPLKLKYKIQKRVVQHYRKKRRLQRLEERDKKQKRAKGTLPPAAKPKLKFKDDHGWIVRANQDKRPGQDDDLQHLARGGTWGTGGAGLKKEKEKSKRVG
mmetsp:Transcript_17138/g.41260  ORF Transcript_17138/g.41260 Transcript_17138/m.41260 type:complete len:149 (+) Transcript_17138:382-828(+)